MERDCLGNLKTQDSSWVHFFLFLSAIFPEPSIGFQDSDEPDRYIPGLVELTAHDFQKQAKWADETGPPDPPPPRLMTSPSSGPRRPIVHHCLYWVPLLAGLKLLRAGPGLVHFASGHRLWNLIDLGSNPDVATCHLG